MEKEKSKKHPGRPSRSESNSTNCIIKDPLMEPFHIQRDTNNFTVYEDTISAKGFGGKDPSGKVNTKVVGYYSNFSNALRKIAKEKFYQNKGEYSSLKEYIDSWNEMKEGIDTMLNKIEI